MKRKFYVIYGVRALFLIAMILALPVEARDVAEILRVVDGDTLKVLYKGEKESVRLAYSIQ